MIGTIITLSEDTVTLSPGKLEGCFGCMAQDEKRCRHRGTTFAAKNSLGLPLSVGQTVEIETPKTELLGQTLQAALPLPAGFLAGFFLLGILFPQAGEPPRVLAGVFALFLAGGITYRVRKRFPADVLPRVVRICGSQPEAGQYESAE
jgi:positive regulator of sigma E activity